jgi:CDP-4-dehydro-6-deoxyglucose reductase
VRETRHHDFVLDERARADGQALLCCVVPGSDMVLETVIARGVEDIPRQQIVTKVSKIEPLANDVLRFYLRTPRSQTLRFLAGQHVALEIPDLAPRHKSIAGCPCNTLHLEFHVHRTRGDPFSEFAFAKLRLNQTVTVTGPEGHFVLDEEATQPIIFLAYETGFPVIKSLVDHALRLGMSQPLHLYWVVRPGSTHYLDGTCRALADSLPNFRYTPVTLPRANTGSARDLLMAAQLVAHEYPDLSNTQLYSNGPPEMMAEAMPVLAARGLNAQQLHMDSLPRI